MNPLVVGGLVVLGLMFLTHSGMRLPNPFAPGKAPPSPPGPTAGGDKSGGLLPWLGLANSRNPAMGTGNVGSPNSSLTTVNQSLVVANNALGLFDQLSNYFGDNSDSEYPVDSGPSGYVPETDPANFGDLGFSDDSDYT